MQSSWLNYYIWSLSYSKIRSCY